MNSQLSLSSQSSVLEDSRRRQSMKKVGIYLSTYDFFYLKNYMRLLNNALSEKNC